MAETFAWPPSLRPSSSGYWIENAARGGGPAANGGEQFVTSIAHRFRFRGTFGIRRWDQALAAQAFFTALDGMANVTLVPAFQGRYANWPRDPRTSVLLSPCRTRRRSLDGTIYQDPDVPPASRILATCAAAAVGATSIAITVTQGEPLRPGQLFGIGERLYRIGRITATAGATQTVDFRPRLREAAADGRIVLLDRPVCRMRQAQPDQCPQDLDAAGHSDLTLEFIEDF